MLIKRKHTGTIESTRRAAGKRHVDLPIKPEVNGKNSELLPEAVADFFSRLTTLASRKKSYNFIRLGMRPSS